MLRTTAFLLLLMTLVSGCVKRTFRIESEPSEAQVFIDGANFGKTPVEIPFDFYGSRLIRLEKQGYQTETIEKKLKPPVYELFPIDFVSENMVPITMQDRQLLKVTLKTRDIIPDDKKDARIEELESRAKSLRKELDKD